MAAPFTRTAVQDFALVNRIYAGATVTFYTVDASGDKTATKATLYDAVSGSGTLANPQTLGSKGKFVVPVYVDEPVIATITGLDNVDDHETGIIASNLQAEAAAAAQAAAALAFAHAQTARAAANRSVDTVFPAAVASTYLKRNAGNTAYITRTVAQVKDDVLSALNAVISTFLGTTTAKAAREAIGSSGLANGTTTKGIVGGAVVPDARITICQAETGTADTITDITATNAAAGDWIGLLADAGDTITIDGGAGNVVLLTSDTDLSENRPLLLHYDGTNWRQVNFGLHSNGSFMLPAGTIVRDVNGELMLATGKVFIGDTANANMTVGLTVNQAGADNEAVAVKSSDIAHGITGVTETDTYALFDKVSGDNGGMRATGLTEGTVAIQIRSGSTTEDTTDTSASNASVEINATTKSGTGLAAAGATANIFAIRNAGTTVKLWKGDGTEHGADTDGATALDVMDDAALLRAIDLHNADRYQNVEVLVSRFDPNRYPVTDLESLGMVGQEDDGGKRLWNKTLVESATRGAIWQMHEMLDALFDALDPATRTQVRKNFVSRGLPTAILDWQRDQGET